jgi:hypothetical protein
MPLMSITSSQNLHGPQYMLPPCSSELPAVHEHADPSEADNFKWSVLYERVLLREKIANRGKILRTGVIFFVYTTVLLTGVQSKILIYDSYIT